MPGKHLNRKPRRKRHTRYYRPYLWNWPNNSPDGKKVCNNVVFKVIHWNNSKTSQSLPYRNPKTHPTENIISEAKHIMNMIYINNNIPDEHYTVPLKSRHSFRQHSLKKKQVKYGKRHHSNYSEDYKSQQQCHELNCELHPDEPNPLRHRILTELPGSWYKKMKIATPPPYRSRQTRAHRRKIRSGLRTISRIQTDDLVLKKASI
tara:strand:- start:222 stop:836 length:615 start_codon:yes stop_codon:yes gene_type:complete